MFPRSPQSKGSAQGKQDLVEFRDLVGIEAVRAADGGQVLQKSNDLGSRWNASAASLHSINGDFSCPGPRGISFTASRIAGGGFVIGLTSAAGDRAQDLADDQSLDSVDFAVHLVSKGQFGTTSSDFTVRERGKIIGTYGTVKTDDKVEVVVNEHGRVEFRHNSQVRYTSEVEPVFPLRVKLCACGPGQIVRDVHWVGPGLLVTAYQHAAREEQHRNLVCRLEENVQEVSSRCEAMSERMSHEHDAFQKSQEQLRAQLAELFQQLAHSEESHEQRFKVLHSNLEETAQERDAAKKQTESLAQQLAEMQKHHNASEDHRSEHLEDERRQLAEHSEELRSQLSQAQGELRERACLEATEVAEQRHGLLLESTEKKLGGQLETHRGWLSELGEQLLERIQEAHQQRLRTSEAELAQLHCSLANEHLSSSERRLKELHQTLAAELQDGFHQKRRQVTPQEVKEEELSEPQRQASFTVSEQEPQPERQLSAAPSAQEETLSNGVEDTEQPRSGAEKALKERLRQLAAIEEKMRLTAARGPPSGSPTNVVQTPQQVNK